MDVSLIYFLLALHAMVEDANQTVDRLGLPHARISDLAQIRDFPLLPPRDEALRRYRGLWAGIRTADFSVGVGSDGVGVTQLQGPIGMENWHDNDHQVGVPRGSVTKEVAYKQARAWLEKMGGDVVALEKEYSPDIYHLELPLTDAETVASGYRIKWLRLGPLRETQPPAVEVCVNAKENWLVRLSIRDLRFYRNRVPEIPHAIAINLLPDEPVRKILGLKPEDSPKRIFSEHGFGFTNAFKLLATPDAYEAEARRLLYAEVKQLLSVLECDQLDEPNDKSMTDIYINPPAFGFGGRLEFKNGEVLFDTAGKLRFFRFLPRGQTNYWAWLSTEQSRISAEDAYLIATQKLAALSVDVAQLDRDYRRVFAQGRYYKYDEKKRRVWFDTPAFWLEWKDRTNDFKPSVVKVGVFGDIKQVGQIELANAKYWTRPPVKVTQAVLPLDTPSAAGSAMQPERLPRQQ